MVKLVDEHFSTVRVFSIDPVLSIWFVPVKENGTKLVAEAHRRFIIPRIEEERDRFFEVSTKILEVDMSTYLSNCRIDEGEDEDDEDGEEDGDEEEDKEDGGDDEEEKEGQGEEDDDDEEAEEGRDNDDEDEEESEVAEEEEYAKTDQKDHIFVTDAFMDVDEPDELGLYSDTYDIAELSGSRILHTPQSSAKPSDVPSSLHSSMCSTMSDLTIVSADPIPDIIQTTALGSLSTMDLIPSPRPTEVSNIRAELVRVCVLLLHTSHAHMFLMFVTVNTREIHVMTCTKM